jgi:type II secretion system protein N
MTSTVLKGVTAAAVPFVVVLALTFPTDQVVRWGLARVPVPAGDFVTFGRAHLRPWGLVLDEAAYRHSDGEAVIAADWVRLRPSWTAFWRDRLGRPWRVGAGILGGTLEGRIADEGTAHVIDVSWTDLDVGSLLAVLRRRDTLTGRSAGRAIVRLPASEAASGEGELTLRSAAWQPPLEALGDLPIHADTATLRWTLGERGLHLSSVDVRGAEVDLTARGTLGLARTIGASTLDLRMTIAPLPGIPLELRRMLDGLPRRSDGVRDFRLTGTLDAPRISPP